jgi:hypothetical protein
VKAAAKDNPVAKKGESYYWWKPRYGSKRYSKTQPRPSQLTTSDFLSRQMELEERIGDLKADTFEDLKSEVESICEEIRMLGEEQSEKKDNLPEGLTDGPTGELLEGRANSCEEWADELEGVDLDVDEPTENDVTEDIGAQPTMADIEDTGAGEDMDALLEAAVADWEQQKDEKLKELQAEYRDKLQEAINELQGISYQGE